MTNDQIIIMMVEDLKKAGTPQRKQLAAGYFSSSMEHFGVTAPELRAIAKKWQVVLRDFMPEQWIGICLELCTQNIFECQQMAYEFIWSNKKVLRALNMQQVIDLGNILDNWASTDSYSIMIAGWHWREGTLPTSQIMKWLKSDNRWMRRVAVVCTVPLNLRARGGTSDTKRTLMVCEQVLDDRDDMVIKALSWALRELSKSDKPAVEDFMKNHWARLQGRVRREVTNKLETGKKNG
jgi:3-methyladenine DNA glycosylase AlkD